jgi:hypothetical protein
MPFELDRAFGNIARFVEIIFRSTLDNLDASAAVACDERFARLCRVIALTERRGYRQIGILLRNRPVRGDRMLSKIFRIIEKDEADHWAPQEDWLSRHDIGDTQWWERAIDGFIHSELVFVKLPLLFVKPWLQRRADWADAHESNMPRTPALAAGWVPAGTRDEARNAAERGPMRPRLLSGRLLSRQAGAMLVRNIVVSCLAFAFDLALLWALVSLAGLSKLEAAAIGLVAANTLHYTFGRGWIFRGTKRGVATGYIYFLINATIGLFAHDFWPLSFAG